MFISPNPPQFPTVAIKITNPYPIELNGLCILCQSPVQFLYNSAEKHIYTLTVLIAERHHLVKCSNKNCPLYHIPFNPTPRFDYSQRNYGKDVLKKIGEYSLQEGSKSRQIHTILKREYDLPISASTVARMCDDILILTSHHIDVNTLKLIEKQDSILIALDGQEPDGDRPALWNFVDIISGRVLMTQALDQVNYLILHDCIKKIQQEYNKPIIGFVSDKQSSIRKCMETFYPDIPHQYCTYHFSTNLWNHLEKYANCIHRKIRAKVKSLYICAVSVDVLIDVPGKDTRVSLKKLCSPLSKELLSTLKVKNKKFKELKGVNAFDNLSSYLPGFKHSVDNIPKEDRFSKILKKTIKNLEDVLADTKPFYLLAKEGLERFKEAHKLLWKEELDRDVKVKQLDAFFNQVWRRCQVLNPQFSKSDRKSFLPDSKTPFWKILAEWTRLWGSYKPGLFQYYKLPLKIKSNVDMEQKFSTENRRFRSQSGLGHIGHLIETRGEFVLRLQYSSQSDYDFDQIIANSKEHLHDLRTYLQEKITTSSQRGLYSIEGVKNYTKLLQQMYEMPKTELI